MIPPRALPQILAALSGFFLVLLMTLVFSMQWMGPGRNSMEPAPVETDPIATSTAAALPQFPYIQIIDSCGPYFEGTCVRARTGPGTDYGSFMSLRTGQVLKTAGTVERDGTTWHRIVFDEWIRYPERTRSSMYVAAAYALPIYVPDATELPTGPATTATGTKRIIVDRSDQKLYAYDGDTLFMEQSISTGLAFTPTPRGSFTIYRKTPSRYMQGPLPGISDQYYDLPGVPWNLYFTAQGAVIHGAYWHDNFGKAWSHGCVNLPVDKARELYQWAELGMSVIVRD